MSAYKRLLSRSFGWGLVYCLVLLTSQTVWAAGPATEGPTPVPLNDMLEAVVNFSLFAALLYFLTRKSVATFFFNRSENIANELEDAKRLSLEAEARLEEYSAKLAGFEEERREILEQLQEETRREHERVIAEAQREAEKLRQQAQKIIRVEAERARRELCERVIVKAVEEARHSLSKGLTKQDQRLLLEQFAQTLERTDEESRPAAH